MSEEIPVFNRETGRMETETVLGRGFMDIAYGSAAGRLATRLLFSRPWFSRLYGAVQGLPVGRRKIRRFIRDFDIDVTELTRPVESYRSFNDFFTRTLVPAARPVEPAPRVLVSPADARLIAIPIADGTVIPVKGRPFTVERLTGGLVEPGRYQGGHCLVFRLAPVDYHRYAYFDAGSHGEHRRLPGRLHSVNPLALWRGVEAFPENARDVVTLETDHFGPVVEVDVGALAVGRIVQHHWGPHRFARGEEKGLFEFGGSTIVLLIAPGRVALDDDIRHHSARGVEVLVRYGSRIGERAGPADSA